MAVRQNPLLMLLQAAAQRQGRPAQTAQAEVTPSAPGIFSYQGRNYGIGDTFNGSLVREAIKDPSQLHEGFRLVDENWGEIARPQRQVEVRSAGGDDSTFVDNPDYAKELAAWEARAKSPGARFIASEQTGKRDYKDTYYIEREGALIPVGSQGRYKPSGWVKFRNDVAKPAAMIALTAIGGPMLGAALGGGALGTIGAGAAISGATTAASGGNSSQIFRNALIGGATAGLSRVATPAIKTALGGTEIAGGVANAATNAGIAALRGGDPLQAALIGGVRGGVSPEAARVLQTVMQLQQRAQPRPAPRPRRG